MQAFAHRQGNLRRTAGNDVNTTAPDPVHQIAIMMVGARFDAVYGLHPA
jgi:hypothetical protein